jgi:hypothetical protein
MGHKDAWMGGEAQGIPCHASRRFGSSQSRSYGSPTTPDPTAATPRWRGQSPGFPNELPGAKRMAGERGKTAALTPFPWRPNPTLCSRMKGPVHLPEVLPVQMGVDLRRGDVGVAEKLLDSRQICPSLEEMGREAVAEGMG